MSNYQKLLIERWLDPNVRIQDTFNVRKADGKLTPFVVPEPQRPIINCGLIGNGVNYVGSGHVRTTVTNKCRQAGFSTITAAEMILTCMDFPKTHSFYCAPTDEQVGVFMGKLDQLVEDSNLYPKELGGKPIIRNAILKNVFTKEINDAHIIGLGANPANIRAHTGIMLILDEMDWMVRFNGQMKGTYTAAKYFVRQGGLIRCLSTPRVKDSMFGQMCENPKKHSVIYFECPAIENWRKLDLQEPLYIDIDNSRRVQKQMEELSSADIDKLVARYKDRPMFHVDVEKGVICQKAKVPYPWITLEQLSDDCQSDLEAFMQENLCTAVDESFKLLNTEWIYRNINSEQELEDRGASQNSFYMTMDFAKKNDLTAITITENVDGIYWERCIEETQDAYDAQCERIWNLFLRFRPQRIGIDNTGLGEVLGDMLVKKLRDFGLSDNILTRVDFNVSTKENMALTFKEWVRTDKYKFLNHTEIHERAIRHCKRVEKEVLASSIRYSGKMHGRDDHFWSKAILALTVDSLLNQPIKSAVASFRRIPKSPASGRHSGQHIIDELHRMQDKINKDDTKPSQGSSKFFANVTKTDEVIDILYRQKALCVSCGKMVSLLYTLTCGNSICPHRKDAEQICRRHNISPDAVIERQSYYEVKDGG